MEESLFFGVLTVVIAYIILTWVWRYKQYRKHANNDIYAIKPKRRLFRDRT